MNNLNSVTITGRLTRDPELKALPSGSSVCNFSLATSQKYKDKDGNQQEETEFHNVVVFGQTAENVAKFQAKGQLLTVQGRLKTRSWEKDGVKQYRTEVIAEKVLFFPKGSTAPSEGVQTDPKRESALPDYPEDDIDPEDIPF